MAGPNPKINIGVEMDPEARNVIGSFVEDVKRRIKELERTRGSDDPELKRQREILDTIKRTTSATHESARAARYYGGELRTVAQVFQSLNVLSGPGGAGLNTVAGAGMNMLAVGGIAAAVTAVATVVGMAAKMGLEFERTTTRAAQNLSIGSGNFKGNLAAIRSAAYSGERVGVGVGEEARAIAAYGISSGATADDAASTAPWLAKYARGYGMDVTSLGGMIGSFRATTNESGEETLSRLFGGAEGAGPLGRRITEFIGAATNTLSALQQANPAEDFGAEAAASLVKNIGQLGGMFQSAQGVQAFTTAASGLMGGTDSNIQKTALAMRAGISPLDMILERNTPANMAKMIREGEREYGSSGPAFAQFLVAATGSPQMANVLYSAAERVRRKGGSLEGLLRTDTAGGAPIGSRVQDYLDEPLSKFDRASAKLENTFTAWGDKIDNFASKGLGPLEDALDGTNDAAKRVTVAVGKVRDAFGTAEIVMGRIAMSSTGSSGLTAAGIQQVRSGHLSAGALYGIGKYAGLIAGELRTPYSGPMHGITNDLVGEIDEITGYGYRLGVYDMNDAAHAGKGPNDPHLRGRAMDIDEINGELIGDKATPLLKKFAQDVLMGNPRARIGAFPALYQYLHSQGWDDHRVFADSTDHIHIDVAPGGNQFTGPQGTQQFTTTQDDGRYIVRTTTKVIDKGAKAAHPPAGPIGSNRKHGAANR